MSNLALSALTTRVTIAKAKFLVQTRHTNAVQEKFLLSLLQAYQGTELGKKYHFRDIKTIEQFRERVPILPYSDYEPWIERIIRGEPNILTPDPVVFLNLTSGSTGKQKLIPVTKRSRKVLSKINQVSMGFLAQNAQMRGLPLGKIFLSTPIKINGVTSGGIPYGTSSCGTLRLNKFLIEQLIAHPYEALLAEDSLTRHYLCLLFALRNPQTRIIADRKSVV